VTAAVDVFVVDNYDSFTMNLVQPLRAWGNTVEVARNDAFDPAALIARRPRRIVLSPGPGRPAEAGRCLELVALAAAAGVPLLGVCLGHQAVAEAFGARVVHAQHPLHGRATPVRHDGQGIFRGLPSPFDAARYHSLSVDPALPEALVATAWAQDGTLMGLRHRSHPVEGVQFHPESYLTDAGSALLRNFVEGPEGPA
jgi:anthranilate synthase component 2